MMICDFLETCDVSMDVELVDIKSGETTVVDTEVFINGDEDDWDERLDNIVFNPIRGWDIKHGRLVIEY